MNRRTATAATIAALASLWPLGTLYANDPTPPTPETTETTTAPPTTECEFPCMANPQPEVPGAVIGVPTGTYQLTPLHRQPTPTVATEDTTTPTEPAAPSEPTASNSPAVTARPQLPATGPVAPWAPVFGGVALALGLGAVVAARRKA
jgi:LPXTG-motif cell wall-anchored protein